MAIGGATIVLLYALRFPRKLRPKSKPAKYLSTASTLLVVILSTLLAQFIVTSGHHLAILGTVRRG